MLIDNEETNASGTNNNYSPEKPVSAKHQEQANDCNENYHALFEQATDAIMVTDYTGKFIDVNSSICTMFGYTKNELLSLNVTSLLDAEVLKTNPLRFDLLAKGENIFNERKMIHKDGTVIYVEANAKKFIDNRIMVIARDITERKKVEEVLRKSEANLHTIFNTTDTIYVLIDNDLRIISYNPRAFAFAQNELGHSIKTSEYFLDYFPVEKRSALLSHMKEVLTGRHINYEVSYPQPGGSFNWYYVKMFPISNGDKRVYGLMMAVSNITEKIALEQKLKEERIKKQLEIADAIITAEESERQDIGRELHDNVKQLLATARLYLRIAKRADVEKKVTALEEVDKLIDDAINEIRNLSHSLISPFLKCNGLADSINHLLKTISKSSEIKIKKEIKDIDENSLPDKLKLTIYRILQEQLANIIKHANAQIIHLKLVHENEKILLILKDDGVGFNMPDKTEGIGLTNIRTRASLFGGQVVIISSPGNGCELRVVFE